MRPVWDLAVVGAGPAGAATAIGALRADPRLRVALLDRADFPRDKACGDGVAPHVIDLLEEAGVTGTVHDRVPVERLSLRHHGAGVERVMARSTWVVPRMVLDQRLVDAAQTRGASLVKHRVRTLDDHGPHVVLDDAVEARVVVGADGAHSVVRPALGRPDGPRAIAVRGYAPTPPEYAGRQVIVFGTGRQPAYAWCFDRGDGLANVGYGELLPQDGAQSDGQGPKRPTRASLLAQLDALLPGTTAAAADWKGHPLPLSTPRWRPSSGRVLVAGDAAGLVNPMTGEGIYYAVLTGLAAGRAAAEALAVDEPSRAGQRYDALTRPLLAGHLKHIAVAARLCRHDAVLDAGLRASGHDQRVFDDLVELGLARGRITPAVVRGLAAGLSRRRTPAFVTDGVRER